jgi:hypothetical protein
MVTKIRFGQTVLVFLWSLLPIITGQPKVKENREIDDDQKGFPDCQMGGG